MSIIRVEGEAGVLIFLTDDVSYAEESYFTATGEKIEKWNKLEFNFLKPEALELWIREGNIDKV